ncbi:MAG TPA: hypothetical protein P5513_03420 [Candidatus Diapherotrites archaeon]|nr:hypothetical protein [Candidatus Diapherotrites archaeon]
MRKKKYWIYDYETIINTFVAVFEDLHSHERHIFIISPYQNDLPLLLAFYKENIQYQDWHLGFNNLAFDSQITEFIIDNHKELSEHSNKKITKEIYNYAQDIITRSDRKEFLDYPEFKLRIPVLDVYKINHWDNQNKRSSLKWIQYSLDWENIEEMPHEHYKPIEDIETLNIVVEYCINDVRTTKQIFKLSLNAINLRIKLKAKYNINCLNYSNTKIGSELLLKLYCDKTGKDKKQLKEQKGITRHSINLEDIVFNYIEFKTEILQQLLKEIKELTIYNTKGDFKKVVKYKEYEFNLGLGGIHQCLSAGIYKSDEEYIIVDSDVASLYPSIAVVNQMYPEHLGSEFYDVYKHDIVDVRLKEKAKKDKGDKAIIEGFKESANASYGNSNQKYSWLFDSRYTMQTTVNGQLMILMLIENLTTKLSYSQVIQSNTDGITVRIKRSEYELHQQICKEWEQLTQLQLEHVNYDKMIIADVNSYFGIYEDKNKTPKCKGRFEWEDLQNHKATHLHKNKSNLIIPKAIYNYFLNDIKPEKYLEDNKNIYDYCSGVKAKGDWTFWKLSIEHDQYKEEKLNKIVRYYISNSGCKIVKRHPDGREIQTESGKWMQTIFNKYEKKEWEDYNININYYLTKIYEEIENIQGPIEDKPVQLNCNF